MNSRSAGLIRFHLDVCRIGDNFRTGLTDPRIKKRRVSATFNVRIGSNSGQTQRSNAEHDL